MHWDAHKYFDGRNSHIVAMDAKTAPGYAQGIELDKLQSNTARSMAKLPHILVYGAWHSF